MMKDGNLAYMGVTADKCNWSTGGIKLQLYKTFWNDSMLRSKSFLGNVLMTLYDNSRFVTPQLSFYKV